VGLVVLNFEQGPEFRPCYIQRFRKYTSFCSDRHKICVTQPARQDVDVDVIGDAGASGLTQIEPHVEAARLVNLAQSNFGALGDEHQLVGGFGRNGGERGEMLVGHNHHMTRGVGVGIQAHEAVQTAMDDVHGLLSRLARHAVSDSIIDRGDHVAEDAMLVLGLRRRPGVERGRDAGASLRVGTGDVAIAPGRPEAVHQPSIAGRSNAVAGHSRRNKLFSLHLVPEAVRRIQIPYDPKGFNLQG